MTTVLIASQLKPRKNVVLPCSNGGRASGYRFIYIHSRLMRSFSPLRVQDKSRSYLASIANRNEDNWFAFMASYWYKLQRSFYNNRRRISRSDVLSGFINIYPQTFYRKDFSKSLRHFKIKNFYISGFKRRNFKRIYLLKIYSYNGRNKCILMHSDNYFLKIQCVKYNDKTF